MRFTIVGTILLCLMAFCLMVNVSGSSLRESDLQDIDLNDRRTSTKKKGSSKKKDCSFTDTKKAAAFRNRVLAQFWEDILKTDCSKKEILAVFNDYFDENIVFTLDGETIATGLNAVSQERLPSIQGSCKDPNAYVSWVALSASISTDDNSVISIVTNRMISFTGQGGYICGYGFSYTGKVTGKKCNSAKLTVIAADRNKTIPGLISCKQ